MMTYDIIAALAAFAFIASITPGPNNLMLMASGINFGFTRTIPHMCGIVVGFTVMIILVGVGLARLFDAVPILQTLLKIVAAAYLLYLAWKIANAAPPKEHTGTTPKPFTFLQAALFQWVNPKAWAMALTAVTAYTVPEQPIVSLMIVAAVFGLVNLPSISAWMIAGTQMRRFLNDPRRRRSFNLAAALLLVATIFPIVFAQLGLR